MVVRPIRSKTPPLASPPVKPAGSAAPMVASTATPMPISPRPASFAAVSGSPRDSAEANTPTTGTQSEPSAVAVALKLRLTVTNAQ
jgi:hypothetical protein